MTWVAHMRTNRTSHSKSLQLCCKKKHTDYKLEKPNTLLLSPFLTKSKDFNRLVELHGHSYKYSSVEFKNSPPDSLQCVHPLKYLLIPIVTPVNMWYEYMAYTNSYVCYYTCFYWPLFCNCINFNFVFLFSLQYLLVI